MKYEIQYKGFWEEDLNNELTVIATIPLNINEKDIFRKYQLLRMEKII
jgi:hypothetical protein